MYIVGGYNKTVFQYTLSTPWNVGTATYDTVSVSVSSQDSSPYGVAFNSDGSKMYILGYTNKTVFQYTLSTPWNVSTATYDTSKSISSQESTPYAVAFNSDGSKMYIVGSGNKTVYQYTVGGTTEYDYVQIDIDIPDDSIKFLDGDGVWRVLVEADISDLGSYLEDIVEDTTPELGGTLVAGDYNITGIGRASFTQELDNGSKSANFTIDFSTDQKQKVTLTENTMTLTLDTTSVGVANYLLKIVNGGLATLTWASESGSIYWVGGTEPTLTSSGTDIVTFYFDGTNWYGMAGLDFK